jgi:hypothetical protein
MEKHEIRMRPRAVGPAGSAGPGRQALGVVKSGVPKDLCCFSLEMGGRNSRGSPVSSALGAPFGAELLDFRVDESPDMSFTKPVSVLYGGVVIQPDTNRFWCPYFFHS